MKSSKISVEEWIIGKRTLAPVIDVRSPQEYNKGHIPGAQNCPLITDEEREELGILYKKMGKRPAIQRGLSMLGERMDGLLGQFMSLVEHENILVYCWRGGMRSHSAAWLLELLDVDVTILDGGYKAYRRYNIERLEITADIRIIGGYTGSGKTQILEYMKKKGHQVLDIEELANHRGSAFGSINMPQQLPNEQFENELCECWNTFDYRFPIWIEDESKTIGSNYLPENLFTKMRKSPVYRILLPLDERIKLLISNYAHLDKSKLAEAIQNISKRIGSHETKYALKALDADDYYSVVKYVLKYYDKTYSFGLSKRDPKTIRELRFEAFDTRNIYSALQKMIKNE